MHPGTFRKAMIEAYLAGANSSDCDCLNLTRKDAADWFDNQYGVQESEECDCCDDE